MADIECRSFFMFTRLVYDKTMKHFVVGIDEVGRGPLAGPITVAAMIKPRRFVWKNFKDSKKLSPKKREEFFLKFKTIPHAVASVSNTLIDRLGIAAAARMAVGRCLKKIATNYELSTINFRVLLDGSLYAPRSYKNQQTIIKGDETIPVIAAASIIAKVHRDRLMRRMHKKYPEYGFAVHKGYGTRAHQAAIRTHGLCDLHRKSFCRKLLLGIPDPK